ncbi:MAG: hypothetical protein ACXV8I_04030 [Methylobacter sp.]
MSGNERMLPDLQSCRTGHVATFKTLGTGLQTPSRLVITWRNTRKAAIAPYGPTLLDVELTS